MTSKKESSTNSKVDEKVETENTNDQGSEFQTATMTPSDKTTSESSAYSLSTMLLALIVAIPTAAIVAYVAVPYELNELLSTENYSSAASNGHMQAAPSMNHLNASQQPEWVKKQNAAMEQRRAEFKNRNAENRANSNAEAPQWVKDHQALMEKEQAKYQQWANQSAEMARNRAMAPTGYGQQPAMGGYQQNPAPNYNRPYYPNGPYNAPYGYPQR